MESAFIFDQIFSTNSLKINVDQSGEFVCELEVPAQKFMIIFRHIHQFLSKHFCLFCELFTGGLQFIQVLLLFLLLILKYGNSEEKTI